MTRARFDGFLFFLLGCVMFVWIGSAWERVSPVSLLDFRGVYYATRCWLQHSDPYQESELLRVYRAEGGDRSSDSAAIRRVVTLHVYLPTEILLVGPFAMLPWGPAHLLWMVFTAASFILAAYLMWNVGSRDAPVISGALICVFLFGSQILLEIGNPAGIVLSLCVIAVWCFLKERFVQAGILCFALSLAVKPHDAGLVWIYFLLAGGLYRKRALQTLVLTAVLCLPAILWVSHVAPHWPAELQTNLRTISAHGDMNDPGPTSVQPWSRGAATVSLQTVFSVFRDDPRFYNPATWLVCAPFLLVWTIATLRSRASQAGAWLALAAIAPLSILPLYHRLHDTRILLLTIPACAMLWAEGGSIAWLALLFTALGAIFTGDFFVQLLALYGNHVGESASGLHGQLLTLVLSRPVPLILLIVGIFYLYVYLRRTFAPASCIGHEPCQQELVCSSATHALSKLSSSNSPEKEFDEPKSPVEPGVGEGNGNRI